MISLRWTSPTSNLPAMVLEVLHRPLLPIYSIPEVPNDHIDL